MQDSRHFQLSKWYADVVSTDGSVFIGYHGSLNWKGFTLDYQSTLQRQAGGEPLERRSIRAAKVPYCDLDGKLCWESAALQFSGIWTPASAPVSATLLSNEDGELVWECRLPSATVCIRAASRQYVGQGYAEHLRMTIPPWKLPIRELRWGRFLAGRESLVWIDWRGPAPKQIAYRNSRWVALEKIESNQVHLESGVRLHLEPGVELRRGRLGSTALRSVPGLSRFAGTRVLAIDEQKWVSRATLTARGESWTGWAIHELVRWP